MGARPGTLLSLLAESGGIPVRNWPLVGAFLLSCGLRSPFSLLEGLLSRKLPPIEDPVFIVGHWRSGTTHLHNVLAVSTRMGVITPLASGLPGELLTLATWLRPLLERALPPTRGLDAVAVTPEAPQEDEIPLASLQDLSVYRALYLPGRFRERMEEALFGGDSKRWGRCLEGFLERVARHQGRPRLLLKNPVHSLRMPRILSLWPGARFIHIYRNPFRVHPSSVHFFERMISRLALQKVREPDLGDFVLDLYPRFMDRLDADAARIPEGQFCEVRFEEFEREPMDQLERIHRELDLPGWPRGRRAAVDYLEGIRSYGKNRYAPSVRDIERVEACWGRFVRRWGYSVPREIG